MDLDRKASKGKDYFGDFLDSMNDVSPDSAASTPAQTELATEPGRAMGRRPQEPLSSRSVLLYCRDHDRPSVSDLAATFGSPIPQMADLIRQLEASGVLTVHGQPGEERITLTENGATLASM